MLYIVYVDLEYPLISSFLHTLRLGPSASEAGVRVTASEDDVLVQLVKSLSHIKSVIDDPRVRTVIQSIAPQLITALGSDDKEVEKAKAGEPTSSRPGVPTPVPASPAVPVDPMPPPPVPRKDVKGKDGNPIPSAAPEGSSPTGEGMGSQWRMSTHQRTELHMRDLLEGWNDALQSTFRT